MRRVDGKSTGIHGDDLLRRTESREWNAGRKIMYETKLKPLYMRYIDVINKIFDGAIVANILSKLRADPRHDPRAILLDTETTIRILEGTGANQTPQ